MYKLSLKLILIPLGWIFFVLGIIGIFVPGLPTTPFLILTAYCFSKSSKRLYDWLLKQPTIGAFIKDWEAYGIIRRRAKIIASTLIVLFFSYTLIFVDVSLGIKIIVALMGTGGITFLWTRPSEK
jgi:uncharacterized protein